MIPNNPKSISKRKHYRAIEAANLALMEQTQAANQALQKAKPKTWLTITIEILRVLIAAISGGVGASIM